MAHSAPGGRSPVTRVAVTVLLCVATGGTLWVPAYARSLPELGGFPFFYWYQLIWVPLAAILCWLCYLLLRTKPAEDGRPGSGRRARE